ncbi:MAG: helix-turn-helix domain-containing protein [Halomonas sp.]|uniref:helix-turn-helix domain-containing protein n=1 Tax=Halomonas sp. TaxID=1486246 RepID=UPI002ACEF249|nr:helix-turn-helix domain-containing protein [Halomonas sp.]MDZ7852364.1 helix-turn-helix domain-containing protein [Halomonas sp.]
MRKLDKQTRATVAVVPTYQTATDIEKALKVKCNIDTSIMGKPPLKAPSKAKQEKEELKAKALAMHEKGMSARAISKELSKSNRTISNWINEYKNPI